MINFLAGLTVSFLGSLPIGVLNVTVVNISLSKGLKSAFYFALACALIEMFYSYLAVHMTLAIFDFAIYRVPIRIVSTIVLIIAGIYYLRKKTTDNTPKKTIGSFQQGVLLSIVNVIAIPFWLAYTAALVAFRWIHVDSSAEIGYYIIGISVGTMLALSAFALLSRKIRSRIETKRNFINKLIGLIFIGSALLEILQVMT